MYWHEPLLVPTTCFEACLPGSNSQEVKTLSVFQGNAGLPCTLGSCRLMKQQTKLLKICTGHQLGMSHEQRTSYACCQTGVSCYVHAPCRCSDGRFLAKTALSHYKRIKRQAKTFSGNGDRASLKPCTYTAPGPAPPICSAFCCLFYMLCPGQASPRSLLPFFRAEKQQH